jgi:predicted nucleotidyltransferase component of viral defense system
MRYATAAAFRTALDERLKAQAAETGLGLNRLRKRVAFELFLRRLVAVAPDRWVLKGALALDLRLRVPARPTKDIDLGRADDEETAIEDITAAQQLALDDFFTFAATRTTAFDGADDFTAIRFHVRAELAGRTFEQFIVDVGFTDPITWTPDTIHTSEFLSFADIEPVAIPAITIPQHLAEKVHAYTRAYGRSGEQSTRPKDLVDILLIAGSEEIDAASLREALERTFTSRKRQALPPSLPPAPESWAAPYRRLAAQVGVEEELASAVEGARTLLDPVLAGEIGGGRWDPATRRWAGEGTVRR